MTHDITIWRTPQTLKEYRIQMLQPVLRPGADEKDAQNLLVRPQETPRLLQVGKRHK
jgi:hypothetical protein